MNIENKENQTENTLELILHQNNLYNSLNEILSANALDLESLQHLEFDKTDELYDHLGLNPVQKLHFAKLMTKIDHHKKYMFHDRIYISDAVHDYIEVPNKIRIIMDTPEFQRLRELKQLGATYFVFPGASHNRFEHSLGVMHLARKLMLSLKMNQPNLNITDIELFCVSAAGLLHDLGHGPFSHVFDHEFVPSMTNASFRHENMSIELIKKLFKDNNIEIRKQLLDLICALVSPSTHKTIVNKYKLQKRGFLFEIIANDENGIDVDKWDYFLRDSHNLNLDISFKYTRLLTHCRVIGDHICFADKTNYDVQILFNTRYDLFKRVYSHKTSKAVEYMICDILRYSNLRFKITDKIQNAQDFMELTDHIIHRIQWEPITNSYNNSDRNAMEQLKKAKKLIERIHTRDLYKCVAYILLESKTVAMHQSELKKKLNNNIMDIMDENDNNNDIKQDIDEISEMSFTNKKIDYHFVENEWRKEIFEIMKSNDHDELNDMKGTEIICQLMSISYGSEKQHPIMNVRFYNYNTPNVSKLIELDQITTLHDPKKYREVIFRVYVKDKRLKKAAKNAFKIFLEKKKLIDVDMDMKRKEDFQFSNGLSPKKATPPRKKHIENDQLKASKSTNISVKRNLDEVFKRNEIHEAFQASTSIPTTPTTPPSKQQKFDSMY